MQQKILRLIRRDPLHPTDDVLLIRVGKSRPDKELEYTVYYMTKQRYRDVDLYMLYPPTGTAIHTYRICVN